MFLKLKNFNFKLKAFSLIEISVYIAIVGMLMLSLTKVKNVMQTAKIQATIAQIQTIIITRDDLEELPTPKIGGIFIIEDNDLILAKNENKEGNLTLSEAQKIQNQMDSIDCSIEQKNNFYIIKMRL